MDLVSRSRTQLNRLQNKLGIDRHLKKFPAQLSVGERQRVSIARAMAHEPSVVIADEPTASLDPINAEEIMGLFTRLTEEKGVTLVVATHEYKHSHGPHTITTTDIKQTCVIHIHLLSLGI